MGLNNQGESVGMNRRDILKRGLAVALGSGVAGKVLTACGGGDHVEAAPVKAQATASYTTSEITDGIVGSEFDNVVTTTSNADKGAWTYTSSNPAVATVAASGVVTYVGLGTTTITVSIPATETHEAVTASYTVAVDWNIPADSGWATTKNKEDILDLSSINPINMGGVQALKKVVYSVVGFPTGYIENKWAVNQEFQINIETGIITGGIDIAQDGIEFPITVIAVANGKSISRDIILVGRDIA